MIKPRCLTVLFVFSTVLVALSSHASFKNAVEFYDEGNHQEAYHAFKTLAYFGDKQAQFNLGVMYYLGEYVAVDFIEAYAWIHLSAVTGDKQNKKLADQIFAHLDSAKQQLAQQRALALGQQYSGKKIQALKNCEESLSHSRNIEYTIKEQVPIIYPNENYRFGDLGLITLSFAISAQGYARDIQGVDVSDADYFASASTALIEYRFEPFIIDGKRKVKRHHEMVFIFAGVENKKYETEKNINQLYRLLKKAEAGNINAQFNYAKGLNFLRRFSRNIDKDYRINFSDANKWYCQSAILGHPQAQYHVGKAMMMGKDDEIDTQHGFKWLSIAAIAGNSFSANRLAMNYLDKGHNGRAIFWFDQGAIQNYYAPKLYLAWELSTNANEDLHDAHKALLLLKEKNSYYEDDVRIYETKAAVYARLNDFKQAIKWQKKAIKKAKHYEWNIPVMHDRLAAYQMKKPWQGYYHANY